MGNNLSSISRRKSKHKLAPDSLQQIKRHIFTRSRENHPSILNLSNDVLLLILLQIESLPDLVSVTSTCSRFNQLYKDYGNQIHLNIANMLYPQPAIKLIDHVRLHHSHPQHPQIRYLFLEMLLRRCEILCRDTLVSRHLNETSSTEALGDVESSRRRFGFSSANRRERIQKDLDTIEEILSEKIRNGLGKMMAKTGYVCGITGRRNVGMGLAGFIGTGWGKEKEKMTGDEMRVMGFMWRVMCSQITRKSYVVVMNFDCWLYEVGLASTWFKEFIAKEAEKESTWALSCQRELEDVFGGNLHGDKTDSDDLPWVDTSWIDGQRKMSKPLLVGHLRSLYKHFEQVVNAGIAKVFLYLDVPLPADPLGATLSGLTNLSHNQKQIIWFLIQMWDMMLGWVERIHYIYSNQPYLVAHNKMSPSTPIVPDFATNYSPAASDDPFTQMGIGLPSYENTEHGRFSYEALCLELESIELVGMLFLDIAKECKSDRDPTMRWLNHDFMDRKCRDLFLNMYYV